MSAPKIMDDDRFTGLVDLLRRTGMRSFQIRYSDDEQPVVWMAVGEWNVGRDARPVAQGGLQYYEAAAAVEPLAAVQRLAERMLNGGTCAHCGRQSGVTLEWQRDMPLADILCWYVWDPELKKFRRSCEAET